MFGYVRPRRDELKVWELEAYQGAYCALCHEMGKRHGFPARFLLNYDFVFLALLLTPETDRPVLEKRRCPARLWCRKKSCCASSPGLAAAADKSTILSWWKLQDTVADASFWERQGARILSLVLRASYRRAAAFQPAFDQSVKQCLGELRELEREGCPSLDRPADTFARLLRAAAPPSGDSGRDRALGELLYHVGRWIYLLDAWDDLEEDLRDGGYNPVATRYPEYPESHGEDLRLTLRHSRNLAASACALLEHGAWRGVVENIIYLGLPSVEELVFSGRWKTAAGKIK